MPLSYYGNIYTLHRQLFPTRCPVMEHVAMQKIIFLFPKHNTLSIIRCLDICSDALLKTRKLITTMEEHYLWRLWFRCEILYLTSERMCFVFKYFDNIGATVSFEYYLAILRKRSPRKLNDDVHIITSLFHLHHHTRGFLLPVMHPRRGS